MQHPAKIYESYTLQKMPSDDILHTIWNQLERHFEGIIPRAYRTEQWATWFADTTQPTSWIVQRLFEHSDMKHQAEYLLPSLPWWPTEQLTTPKCLNYIEGFGTTVLETTWLQLGMRNPEGAYALAMAFAHQTGWSLLMQQGNAIALLPFFDSTQRDELAPFASNLINRMFQRTSPSVWTVFIERQPEERLEAGFLRGMHEGKQPEIVRDWLLEHYTPTEISMFQDYCHIIGAEYHALPGEGSALRPALELTLGTELDFQDFVAASSALYDHLPSPRTLELPLLSVAR